MTTAKPTITIAFQSPPESQLTLYNRRLPASQQSPSIPSVFRDAMDIRDAVFVKEQKNVPLVHHIDPGDARSQHWVIYASSPETQSSQSPQPQPVGTVRLAPFPQDPHPEPGGVYEAPGEDAPVEDSRTFFTSPPQEYKIDRATSLHDGKEPYLQIGRLCILEEFRGHKFADVLIQTALKWASENAGVFKRGNLEWKGLVCVHASERAVTTWQRNGFVIDQLMGSWKLTGAKHFGLFLRLKIEK